jgi:hypothetical protein
VSAPEVQVFDLRGEPPQLPAGRWTPHVRRDPAQLRGAALHGWGVRQVGTLASQRARYGEPLALARRALRAPYGITAGVTARGGVPVVSIAHPLERYTYASDAGNMHFLAIGVMGLFPFLERQRSSHRHTPVTEALIAAVDVAMQVAARLLAGHAGAEAPWPLITHRQCANGPRDHVLCPGQAVVEMALRSGPARDGLFVAEPDLVLDHEHGLRWPEEWRAALPAPSAKVLDLPLHLAENADRADPWDDGPRPA